MPAQPSFVGVFGEVFAESSFIHKPGDSVFVPGVLDRRSAYSVFIQGFKDWTSILYQFGLSAAAIKTLRQ